MSAPTPSEVLDGDADHRGDNRGNRWSRAIDARPTAPSAAGMWAFYVAGSLLIILAVYILIASVLALAGEIGMGWTAGAGGGAGVVLAALVFTLGRWLTKEFRVQRKR